MCGQIRFDPIGRNTVFLPVISLDGSSYRKNMLTKAVFGPERTTQPENGERA